MLESFAESIHSTSQSHSLGTLSVLEFTDRNTVDSHALSHKYENQDKLPSDHQSLLSGLPPSGSHSLNPPLHTYHGSRCLVTNSALSRAEIEL